MGASRNPRQPSLGDQRLKASSNTPAATIAMPDQTKLKLDLTFSKWDVPVSIGAPPADQVKPKS